MTGRKEERDRFVESVGWPKLWKDCISDIPQKVARNAEIFHVLSIITRVGEISVRFGTIMCFKAATQ